MIPLGLTISPWYQMQVRLSDCPGFTELTQLFDLYRITDTVCSVHYGLGNTDDIASLTGVRFPTLVFANDIDGSTPLQPGANLYERSNTQVWHVGDNAQTSMQIQVPCFVHGDARGIDGSVTTNNRPLQSPWLNTTSPTSYHGQTLIAAQGEPGELHRFNLTYSITIECKHAR